MTQKILKDFVVQIREAAASEDRKSAMRELLQDSQSRKVLMADAIAALEEDEVMFFEDETCSIWTCRYDPNVVFAPHEHGMGVHIAVYRGTEVEVLYNARPASYAMAVTHWSKPETSCALAPMPSMRSRRMVVNKASPFTSMKAH